MQYALALISVKKLLRKCFHLSRYACGTSPTRCCLNMSRTSFQIVHRDLAARNVLVGEGENCKITDFGMARVVQEENIYEQKTKVNE